MRLYIYITGIIGAIIFLYFWHYKPIAQIDVLKQQVETEKKLHKNEISELKKSTFEEHQIQNKKLRMEKLKQGVKHEEVNLSYGNHSIRFGK